MIKVKKQRKPRIFQGDVFKDIKFIEYAEERAGIIEVSKIVFPSVIILTQDFDIAQDYKFRFSRFPKKNQNKWLISVIEFPNDIPIVPSIIDFKHYFSVNVNYLKRIKASNFICRISELYREDISQRFVSFLARIALP